MHCTVVYPLELYPAFFGYYFFNAMMGVLQLLHIFWAFLIIRMAHKFITGKVKGGGSQPRSWGVFVALVLRGGNGPHAGQGEGGGAWDCPGSEVGAADWSPELDVGLQWEPKVLQ